MGPEKERKTNTVELPKEEDDEVGCVKWEGPGPLIISAGNSRKAMCKVVLEQPMPNEIFMVETSIIHPSSCRCVVAIHSNTKQCCACQ